MKAIKQTLLLCTSIAMATFFGCKTIDEELAESRAKGVQQLDSFLGIELGSAFPGSNEVKSYSNEWNDNGRVFDANQKLLNAPLITNWVRLTADGCVYEINSHAQFYYETPLGLCLNGLLPWPFSRENQMNNAAEACERELESFRPALEKKYGKELVCLNSTKSVMPFANDRKITVVKQGFGVTISAVDERLAAEGKKLVKREMFETCLNDSDPRSIVDRDTTTSKKTK